MPEPTTRKSLNKDPRWNRVLGIKTRKWNVKSAIDKLERVIRINMENEVDPVQYEARNVPIIAEVNRLRDVFDYHSDEMQELIDAIHVKVHKE